MNTTTLLIYVGLTALGWFLRHQGVFAQDAGTGHPVLALIEKLIAGKLQAESDAGTGHPVLALIEKLIAGKLQAESVLTQVQQKVTPAIDPKKG